MEALNEFRVAWRKWTNANKPVPINSTSCCNSLEKLKVYYFQNICDAGEFMVVGNDEPVDPGNDTHWPLPSHTKIDLNEIHGLGVYRHECFDDDEVLPETRISPTYLSAAFGPTFENTGTAHTEFENFCNVNPDTPVPNARVQIRTIKGKEQKVWILQMNVGASANGLHDPNNNGVELVVPFEASTSDAKVHLYRYEFVELFEKHFHFLNFKCSVRNLPFF